MSLNHLKNNSTADIYTDLNGLKNLKSSARNNAQKALPEVARQFEAVMISMMIKNLRKTGMEDPIFKSQAMDSYRDMYDQQLGMELSKGQGIGLAKSIVEQMQYQAGYQNNSEDTLQRPVLKMPERRYFPDQYSPAARIITREKDILQNNNVSERYVDPDYQSLNPVFSSPGQFVKKLWPLAEQTASQLGVSPEIILSQAALETGWGQFVISNEGKSSFNLFNIKADQSWQGKRMEKTSIEFFQDKGQQTKPIQQKSDFRVYDSFAQSFADYARMIQSSPRYKSALENTAKAEQTLHDELYIKAIHKSGYATDPLYANKVLRVLNSEPIQNQLKLASK